MIDRYSRPQMAALFTDQARMNAWLRVEQAALRAMADAGIAPAEAADALEQLHVADVARAQAREAEIHHDLAAFVDVIAEDAPGAAGWVHYGLTSSDVVDTALALQLVAATKLVIGGVRELADVVLLRAREHRTTVMLGRTHGMPAETITFGAKLAGWWHQLQRDATRLLAAQDAIAVGKLSGAVGAYSGVGPEIERAVLDSLRLERDPSATQIVQRDRHAQLLGALAQLATSLERIALEVRHLQRSEVGEVAEPFGRAQKGSSAMPHKRNPIVAEQVCGLARVVRGNAGVALENVALWHERDISHSSTERVIIPDTFALSDYLLAKVTWLVGGLDVDAERMLANVAAQRGLVASQRVLLALVAAGAVRDDAYRAVQAATAATRANPATTLAAELAAEPAVTGVLDEARLAELCDPAYVPAGIDVLFAELDAAIEAAH
jgi:adenylosuccinate lyase